MKYFLQQLIALLLIDSPVLVLLYYAIAEEVLIPTRFMVLNFAILVTLGIFIYPFGGKR